LVSGPFVEICRKYIFLVQIEQQYRTFHVSILNTFMAYCWQQYKLFLALQQYKGNRVSPWLTNSIRSRRLVVTQVGCKSRLFFP
jgi:hypothetical protein